MAYSHGDRGVGVEVSEVPVCGDGGIVGASEGVGEVDVALGPVHEVALASRVAIVDVVANLEGVSRAEVEVVGAVAQL